MHNADDDDGSSSSPSSSSINNESNTATANNNEQAALASSSTSPSDRSTISTRRRGASFSRLASSLRQSIRLVFVGKRSNTDNDIAIVRYSVAVCHIFLLMTVTQLLLACWSTWRRRRLATTDSSDTLTSTRTTRVVASANIGFHIVYCLCYASFLGIYALKKSSRPNWSYVIGIVLYFFGYTLFLVLFVLQLEQQQHHDAADDDGTGLQQVDNAGTMNIDILYKAGSLLFLVGSLFLMHGTYHRKCLLPTNVLHRSSGLFWGSASFFVGSTLFSVDALLLLVPSDSNEMLLLVVVVVLGLAFFTMGRAFFLHGSTTESCNVWFRDVSSSTTTT